MIAGRAARALWRATPRTNSLGMPLSKLVLEHDIPSGQIERQKGSRKRQMSETALRATNVNPMVAQ